MNSGYIRWIDLTTMVAIHSCATRNACAEDRRKGRTA